MTVGNIINLEMKEAQTLACQRQDLTQKLSTLTPGYHDMTLFCDTGNL